MSLIAKVVQLAPVILATGATLGLLVVKVDDPKTKKIIRVIAVLLGIGTAFSIVTQVPVVLAAIEEGVKAATKMVGMDDKSRLARIRKQAEIDAAKAQAESEARASAAKAEADRLAYERKKEQERIAYERRVADEKRALDASIAKSKADADRAKADAELAGIDAARQASAAADRAKADAELARINAARQARAANDARRLEQIRCVDTVDGRFCCQIGQQPETVFQSHLYQGLGGFVKVCKNVENR